MERKQNRNAQNSAQPEKSLDTAAVDRVLSLDDEQLKQAVHALAIAGGMDARRADMASRDANKIRRKLNSITEADFQKLLSQVKPEQLQAIAEQLKNIEK